jgi:hypothetical protein
MIKADLDDHAATINALAERGILKPAAFELDGKRYDANSHWAATDWLKKHGLHKEGRHRWLAA